MDASKGQGSLVAEMLSVGELAFCDALLGVEGVQDAWVAGGALMRKESKDVDIIVYMDSQMTEYDDLPHLDIAEYEVSDVYMNYAGETDDNVDVVVKMRPIFSGRPIDLLLVSNRCFRNITDYITYNFPLTVQMIAWDICSDTLVNKTGTGIGCCPEYVTVNSRYGPCGAYTRKYLQYYPNATFVHKGKHIERPKESFSDATQEEIYAGIKSR